MPSPVLLPLLACAVVLLVSGVAKLRAPGTVDSAFTALEVPAVLDSALLRRLSPRLEVGEHLREALDAGGLSDAR